jgi:hypothetical protein
VSGNQAIQYYGDGDNYSWRTDFQILDQDTVFESGDKITTWIETDPGGSGLPFQDHSAVIEEF